MITCRNRRLDFISLAILLLAGLWLSVPSSVFIKPQALIYDGRQATLRRLTPWGAIDAEWHRELYVVGTRFECHAPPIVQRVQKIDGYTNPETGEMVAADTVSWTVGGEALDCLRAEPPIIATHTWRVLIFGVIPLRPVRLTTTIETSLLPPCDDVRVSDDGRFHEPGSSQYGRVAAAKCFPTAEEAEAAGYTRAVE